jgi:hypothetical protein
MGLSERSEFIAGSFFESIPSGSDALILKSVIHDWDDEHSTKILENCRRALVPGAKLLLVERIMPDTVGPNAKDRYTVMSDLNVLRAVGEASGPRASSGRCSNRAVSGLHEWFLPDA